MRKHACLPVLLLAGACASEPPTEDELADRQYDRDVAHIEASEEYERMKTSCTARGGTVVVNQHSSRRMKSSSTEKRLATCTVSTPGRLF